MSKDCGEFQGLIAAALYGPLDPADQSRLQSHLSGCDACRRESAELAGTVRLLGRPESEPVDVQRDAFAVALKRKIGKKTARKAVLRPIPAARPAWVLPASLAAAFMLVIVGVVLYPRPHPVDIAVRPPDPLPAPKPAPPIPPPPVPALKPPAPPPVVPSPPTPPPDLKPAPVEPSTPTPAPKPKPEPAPTPEPPPPPPPPVVRETVAVMAHIESFHGEVAVSTETGRVPAKPGMDLIPGHLLQTGARAGSVVIKITDGTRITLAADSILRLAADVKAGAGRRFELSRGLLRAEVMKQPAGAPMLFETPTADARVLGTELLLSAAADSTRLEVRTGKVKLIRREDGVSADVAAGQVAVAPRAGAFAARPARHAQGLQALYTFHDAGNQIHDLAGAAEPLDLRILKGRVTSPAGLRVEGNPRLETEGAATRLIDACRKTQELTLEAWVQPARAAVDFEGAVVSLSTDVQDRDFALAQKGDAWEAALRTSATDGGGRPPLSAGKGSSEAKLTHLVFTRTAAGQERLYVNGVEKGSRVRPGTFATWNDGFHLFLGNESFEERPWSGVYRLVAIYSQALSPAEIARNFKVGVD
jgi:hypothetical protein